MSRQRYLKKWADSYLADVKIRALSWGATGVNEVLWAIALTQTDKPGWFVFDGKAADFEALCVTLGGFKAVPKGWHRRYLRLYLREVLDSGLYVQSKSKAWYSPRIVKEHEESEVNAKRGSTGGTKTQENRSSGALKGEHSIEKKSTGVQRFREPEYRPPTPIEDC